MDFKEWFESRDDIGCLIGLEGYAAEQAWNARQAEIDALKSQLRTVLDEYYITDYYNPNTCRSAELLLLMPSIYTDDEVKIEIQEILK